MFHDEQTPGHDGKVPALARVTVLRIGMTVLTALEGKHSSVAGLLLLLGSHQWED